jgi:hypothetical protein
MDNERDEKYVANSASRFSSQQLKPTQPSIK